MDNNNSVPRFRTIKQCLQAIQNIDPETAITEWYLRQLCQSDKIAHYGSGNKCLVNLDSLLDYLNRSLDEINQEKNSEKKSNE